MMNYYYRIDSLRGCHSYAFISEIEPSKKFARPMTSGEIANFMKLPFTQDYYINDVARWYRAYLEDCEKYNIAVDEARLAEYVDVIAEMKKFGVER